LQPSHSFTGRTRRRTTHPWVRAGDSVARFVITAGGIGTIVAVLGVLVFLVAVTAPLFGSARITAERTLDLSPENGPKLVAVGCDETGLIAWTLFEDGRLQAFSTRDGSLLIDRPGTVTGLFGIRCVRRYGTDQSVVLMGTSAGCSSGLMLPTVVVLDPGESRTLMPQNLPAGRSWRRSVMTVRFWSKRSRSEGISSRMS
jgi:hypothetical protein